MRERQARRWSVLLGYRVDVADSILVVDDNAENRALAQAALGDEDYEVRLANDGAAAIAAVQAAIPDCILMDVRMPKLDGIEACRRIRALPGADVIAIIFVTAQREVETFDRALAAGGDDFITKPYRPDELVVRVGTALRLRRLATERGHLVAELKDQRDRLQRVELHKEQLVAFLVHDLKNPVHTIELDARAIQRNSASPERVRTAAGRIHDESVSLLRMITNLLDISRADEGHLVPARRMIDAEELVRKTMAELGSRAAGAKVELALDLGLGVSQLHVDPDLMARVIANLLDNAIRHAPEGSAVRLALVRVEGGIELRIRDAGSGVPADQRDQVFERFQRGGARSARSNHGLGLAFCKLVVDAHGGRIWIEDGSPGAVFCVWLSA